MAEKIAVDLLPALLQVTTDAAHKADTRENDHGKNDRRFHGLLRNQLPVAGARDIECRKNRRHRKSALVPLAFCVEDPEKCKAQDLDCGETQQIAAVHKRKLAERLAARKEEDARDDDQCAADMASASRAGLPHCIFRIDEQQ